MATKETGARIAHRRIVAFASSVTAMTVLAGCSSGSSSNDASSGTSSGTPNIAEIAGF